MRTYRELFGLREFRALFAVVCIRNAATTLSGIALGILVYARTASPLLAAVAMFGSSLAQAVGAATLLALSDRLSPRAAVTAIGASYAALTFFLASPAPVWALLTVVSASGVLGALNGGVQWGLLREVVPAQGYLLSRSAFTVSAGLMQVLGFGAGGALANVIGARPTLLLGAGLYGLSSVGAYLGLRARAPRSTATGALRRTWEVNRALLASSEHRILLLALWVPTGLIVGCEALFIPYSPRWAGLLLCAAAVGMLTGDIVTARVLRRAARARVAAPLRLVLAAPYLLFASHPPLLIAAAAIALASTGYSAGLLLQERLLAITPDTQTGQLLGLHSAGMLTLQAVAAITAGLLAQIVSTTTAITVLAATSLIATITLATTVRRIAGPPTKLDTRSRPRHPRALVHLICELTTQTRDNADSGCLYRPPPS